MRLEDLPRTLPDSEERYIYPSSLFFKTEYDVCRAFVMQDYAKEMHIQEFFEINIIIKGEGAHYIEDNRLLSVVGDVFVIPPNVRHGYVGGKGFDVLHILISNRFLERERSELSLLPSFNTLFHVEPIFRAMSPEKLCLHLSNSQLQRIKPIIDELLCHNNDSDLSASLIRRGLVLALITLLCDSYTQNGEVDYAEQFSLDKAFLEALAIVHERYYEKITIESLSKTALLSRSAFIQKFKRVCKMPPAKYLEKRRVEAACYMLRSTALSITEIAARVGFHDSSHLSRSFVSFMGVSPGQYRKSFSSELFG